MDDDLRHLSRAMQDLRHEIANATKAQSDLASAMRDLRSEIERTYVRKDVLDPTLKAMEDDIKAHSDWILWVTRIVIALVITAVVGYAMSQGGGI